MRRALATRPIEDANAPRALRGAALVSVYSHALHGLELAPAPGAPAPMPLEEAARILRNDTSEHAESRRRRAIARLAATEIDHPTIRHALTLLGSPLDDLMSIAPRGGLKEAALGALGALGTTRAAVTNAILARLDDVFGPATDKCRRTTPVTHLEWLSGQRLARVKVTVSVRRPDGLAGIRKALDPQNWDRCSDFIVASYVAQDVAGAYPVDEHYDATAHLTPPQPGTSWQGVVFEHLAVTFGVTFSWFKQLLTIESHAGPDTYRFDYRLHSAIRSGVLLDERDGGIDINEGHAMATLGRDGWIDVEATKALRFTERPFLTPLLNTWAVIALAVMGDEMWDNVCCNP